MDKRSWPWKKKSSDKTVPAADTASASLPAPPEPEKPKKATHIKIPVETYEHLTGLEGEVKILNDQVKALNDEVDDLNEQLSSAQAEITTKENIVKQHAKVAEEAVSGWEKADAEALALKQQLESVTLLKLTAEDKAAHLDGALKECMRQIRSLKEEHERKLHETILTKTKQWEKIRHEFEMRMGELDEDLLRASAENSALSRALQERSNMLMEANEERSRAEAEIELLKNDIQSCEKEINSLKYELHIVSKELDIRNEEKNMSMKSAENANRQHLEGVKKIAKLEAECQRLRGLVRKKLPGPAALAQMKLEVESLGRDYGETRSRRSPGNNASSHLAPPPEISLENVQQCQKENEFLMGRCLAMEEEMKMLKEALAKRNSELQVSRNVSAKTMSKLRGLEAQVHLSNPQKGSPRLNLEMPAEGFSSQNGSNPPSLMSLSEDGIDEEGSCAESWATPMVPELLKIRTEKSIDKSVKPENINQLELMDDFLEMERLACFTESNGPASISESMADVKSEHEHPSSAADVAESRDIPSVEQLASDSLSILPKEETLPAKTAPNQDESLLKFHSRLSMIYESEGKGADMRKVLEDIKHIMQDMEDALSKPSVNFSIDKKHSPRAISSDTDAPCNNEKFCSEAPLILDSKQETSVDHIVDEELVSAIHQIHNFVICLSKEVMGIQDLSPDGPDVVKKPEEFSEFVNEVLCGKMSFEDFILNLSHVLGNASALSINLSGFKGNGGENNSSDYIDKVTLLEKRVVQDDSFREEFPNSCAHISHSTSDPEALAEGNSSPGVDAKFTSCRCSFEEVEKLKSEKENIEIELSACTQNLEQTKFQLQDSEKLLTELKLQLVSSQKSNSLAETQLKCMAESYNILETRAQELDAEVNLLRGRVAALDLEVQEEKQKSENALATCKDLEEQLQRNETCPVCATAIAEADLKSKKEREIAAATEKLAMCQETIFLLGKQLKALGPSEHTGSPSNDDRRQSTDGFLEDEKSPPSRQNLPDSDESVTDSVLVRVGSESPSDIFNYHTSPSEDQELILRSPLNSKHPTHRSTKSSSSSITPEKHPRGISRFFSSKSKISQ